MKIRTDYVTNSSSSSFVIGKKEDTSVTVDVVFGIVKDLYNELYHYADELKKYLSDNPKYKMKYVEKDDYGFFKFIEKLEYEKRMSIEKEIERNFHLSLWDYIPLDKEWLNCNTYKEYENYWIKRMENADYRTYAPFTIGDFTNPEIHWLHFKDNYNNNTHKLALGSDVLEWYYPYIEEALAYDSCETCPYPYCEKEEKDTCMKVQQKKENLDMEHLCLDLLGRICIYSESGYIPNFVVERLREISEYSCNHMG